MRCIAIETREYIPYPRDIHSKQSADAKYPTGLIVDLSGPQGNIYALIGMCNHIIRELGLSPQEREEYETELNAAEDYKAKLEIMRRWFGIVFTGLED